MADYRAGTVADLHIYNTDDGVRVVRAIRAHDGSGGLRWVGQDGKGYYDTYNAITDIEVLKVLRAQDEPAPAAARPSMDTVFDFDAIREQADEVRRMWSETTDKVREEASQAVTQGVMEALKDALFEAIFNITRDYKNPEAPRQPKFTEPQGDYAVVDTEDGNTWVREPGGYWQRQGDGATRHWDEIARGVDKVQWKGVGQ